MLKKGPKIFSTLAIYTILCLNCYFFSSPLNAQNPVSENINVSLSFDGIDDWVSAPSGTISGNDDFTLETWIWTANTNESTNCPSNFRRVIGWGGGNTRFEIGSCGGILAFYSNESNFISSGISLTDGNWHHLAATKTNNDIVIYLDGDAVITYSTPNAYELGNFFRIGRWPGGGTSTETWAGLVDEVRLWDFARPLEEILETKDNCLAGGEAGLVTYYNFNDGRPFGDNPQLTTVRDISRNGNDGELRAFGLFGDVSNFVESVPFEGVCMEECPMLCLPEGENTNNLFIAAATIDGVNINNNNNAYTVFLDETISLGSDVVPFTATTTNPEGTEIDSVFWRVLYDANNDGEFSAEEVVFNSGKVPVGEVEGELDFSALNLSMVYEGNIAVEMTTDIDLQDTCDGAMIPLTESWQRIFFHSVLTGGKLTVVKKKKGTTRSSECIECLPLDGTIEFGIDNTTGFDQCNIAINNVTTEDVFGNPINPSFNITNYNPLVDIYRYDLYKYSRQLPQIDLFHDELALYRATYSGTLNPIGERIKICVQYQYEENCDPDSIKTDTGCFYVILGCLPPNTLDTCTALCPYFTPTVNPIIVNTEEEALKEQVFNIYPNPFKHQLSIEFELIKQELVTIKLLDMMGREVQQIIANENLPKGKHLVNITTDNLPLGLYFVKIQVGNYQFGKGIIHSE